MSELRARYPRLELRPTRGRSIGLTDAVKSGELDAAVVAEPEGGGSVRLHWQPLLRSEMRLIVPPEATETSVPALFKQYEWIRYDRQTISGHAGRALRDAPGPRPGAARWSSTACPRSSRW